MGQRRATFPITLNDLRYSAARSRGFVISWGAAGISLSRLAEALIPVLLRNQHAKILLPARRQRFLQFITWDIKEDPADTLPLLTLPWDLFTILKLEFFGNVNFLRARWSMRIL